MTVKTCFSDNIKFVCIAFVLCEKGITTVTLNYVSIETLTPQKNVSLQTFLFLNSCFIKVNETRGKTKEEKKLIKMTMRQEGKKKWKKNHSICRNRTAYRREKESYRQ